MAASALDAFPERTASAARVPGAAVSAAVGASLCGLTMLFTAWTLLATGWVDGAGGALVVALAAVVEAAVLAHARVPRSLALALVPVLAMAAIIPATISALPLDGDSSFWHLIGRYVGASFGGLASTQDWPFTVGLCAVLWLCGYWMTWMALREHRGVLAVLPVYIILATNVLNQRTGREVALPAALSVGLSLLVVANAHLDSLQSRWRRRRVKALAGIRSGMVGSAAVVAVGILVVGSVLPRATTQDISGTFFSGVGGSGSHAGTGVGTSRATPAAIGFSDVTQPGGPLISTPKPVLTYTSSTAAPVYLRVVNDTVFSQGNWYPEHGPAFYDHNLAFTGVAFGAGALPLDSAAASKSSSAVVTIQVNLRSKATGDVDEAPFAGEPVSSSAGGTAYGTVDESRSGGRLVTVDVVKLSGGSGGASITITTSATVSTATQDALRTAGTRYPDWAQRYTLLRDDGTHEVTRIASLAREWTRNATNPYDQASAIEQRLRDPSSFTYTLNPPDPPPNEWPVVYFLTKSHRGYCQYFASAMGAMLRSLGIPTRVVNGYGPGSTRAVGNRHGQRVQQVTTSDAHTWVEAYFPGYGWITFEPTPPSPQGDYSPIFRGAVPGPSSTSAADIAEHGGGSSNGSQTPAVQQPSVRRPAAAAAQTPDLRLVGLSLLAMVGTAVLLGSLWLLFPRSQRGAWRRLEVLGLLLGVRRRTAETHHAYARRFTGLLRAAGPLHDDRVARAVIQLARDSTASEFARPGGEQRISGARRRVWMIVFRASPRIGWRALMRRAAAG
jgi:transglutaminase-like putative cysteine protease